MILITLGHPGDVRHMHATELKPCFKYVSARLKPELWPQIHSFNFIALSAFIKTHLSQRERQNEEERKESRG